MTRFWVFLFAANKICYAAKNHCAQNKMLCGRFRRLQKAVFRKSFAKLCNFLNDYDAVSEGKKFLPLLIYLRIAEDIFFADCAEVVGCT